MQYRRDIDGLRAIAVLSVMAYHSGITLFSGGFVGVDVFFVISGYLITTLIYQEAQNGDFSFLSFYKRRAARLLPALAITLALVAVVGFFLYDAQSYDKVGKDIFFSALGVVNIYFAQGTDYFVSAEFQQPLIHLWSLGVEEQFYLLWPLLLLALAKGPKRLLFPATLLLFAVSLGWSEWAAQERTKGAYFLPQYRAFELLLGAVCAFLMQRKGQETTSGVLENCLGVMGVVLIVAPMMLLDGASSFPGLNALWPCLGTALLILCPGKNFIAKALSIQPLVLIGLISYPLYLYHQPLITFIEILALPLTGSLLFVVLVCIAGSASWLTYTYVEKPVRRLAHKSSSTQQRVTLGLLVASLPLFAVVGLILGRTDGLPQRFSYLNPYANVIVEAHEPTFESVYTPGFQIGEGAHSGLLVVGDSLAQQYAKPMQKVLGLSPNDVDTVTRGACVFLKGVDFREQMAADESCDALREKLYRSEKRYDVVVISQAWHFYKASVNNFVPDTTEYGQWQDMVKATVEHFKQRAKVVIVVGAHPMVVGTGAIQASIFMTPERYQERLQRLQIENLAAAQQGADVFTSWFANDGQVLVINPISIFCATECVLHNQKWSYFADHMHYTQKASAFLEQQLSKYLASQKSIRP